MSQIIVIYGESGTGKSTSIRTLDQKETFIINVIGKPLPFKGWKNQYTLRTKETGGNMLISDNSQNIVSILTNIDKKMPEIKNIIIDDFQYTMGNEFMRRATEKGYEKFTQIGQNAWNIINQAIALRDDIKVFFLTHSDTDEFGRSKIKTIGKMLDDKICIAGMFTIVLYSTILDDRYVFLTQSTQSAMAKSPLGMFDDKVIDNDLSYVISKMNEYEIEDIKQ
ncbi:MAG: hypothetical protein AMQ22_00699 [Candidatus Methanofastidiosum methylothiophilum]|uniref:AAA+ ATPase domain-containing protein n=1 Tax=Candidatus Methanofastidiosum methylothiophilum TaxID=1705564 RepID=A0A150J5Y3_9EURY|nr:MAG: hypothetical protein AMQ22_00699 [Candidatus Methanofastidiosum methylthiophilus]